MTSPSIDLVGKIPILQFAVRSLNGGSRLVSCRLGLLHWQWADALPCPLVDDDLPADHISIGVDVRVEIPFVHEGVEEISASACYLHQRYGYLAIMDAGAGHCIGDRDAEVVGCQMGLVPYVPLFLAL